MSDVSGSIPDISGIVSGLSGSLSSAMNFTNLKINIFGCDLGLNCPPADYFNIQEGSGGSEQPQLPVIPAVAAAAQNEKVSVNATEQVPFATPGKGTENVNYKDNRVGTSTAETRAAAASERNLARQAITLE